MKLKDLLNLKVAAGLKSLETKGFQKKLARTARNAIVTRTRLGFGVDNPGSSKSRLAKLDPGYIKERRHMRFRDKTLSKKTRPAFSNLTKTGEMLDTVHFKISGKDIEIRVKPDQEFKVKGNADFGRVFFNLSDLEQKQLLDMIKKRLRDFARK